MIKPIKKTKKKSKLINKIIKEDDFTDIEIGPEFNNSIELNIDKNALNNLFCVENKKIAASQK